MANQNSIYNKFIKFNEVDEDIKNKILFFNCFVIFPLLVTSLVYFGKTISSYRNTVDFFCDKPLDTYILIWSGIFGVGLLVGCLPFISKQCKTIAKVYHILAVYITFPFYTFIFVEVLTTKSCSSDFYYNMTIFSYLLFIPSVFYFTIYTIMAVLVYVNNDHKCITIMELQDYSI